MIDGTAVNSSSGYGLDRQVISLGHECSVVTPSLILHKAGDRVETNRHDAIQLSRLLRADELTAVWAPDKTHEVMRNLVQAKEVAADDLRRKRHAIPSLLLKHGWVFAERHVRERLGRLEAAIVNCCPSGYLRRWWRHCRRCAALAL